jgi:hypothetical protein
MAEFPKSSEAPVRSAFAEGAERLDSIVQSVRAQQTGECSGTHCVTDYSLSTFSPDEVWAKNYATRGIGPQLDPLPSSLRAPIEKAVAASDFGRVTAPSLEARVQVVESDSMGFEMGKAVSKRPSALRRVLFGRNA